jgi:hypothetical protein
VRLVNGIVRPDGDKAGFSFNIGETPSVSSFRIQNNAGIQFSIKRNKMLIDQTDHSIHENVKSMTFEEDKKIYFHTGL